MSDQLKFKFDPNLQHQTDAIESVVGLFDGMRRFERDENFLSGEIVSNLPEYEALEDHWLLDNLNAVQERAGGVRKNMTLDADEGLVIKYAGNDSWRYPSFTVEMETGTGKTYVYLRTIYELRQRYGFSKFIVVVPSVAIYEGLVKNFQVTRDHFRSLYGNERVNLVEYDGAQISRVRSFATSTFADVMVMTIQSLNKHYNRIYKPSEELPGELLPYEYLQKTRPILIFDEPQSTVSTKKSKEAVRTLNPLLALRYSATHRESPNLVYRLTPFDAYQQNLVKKIQVIGITERENFNQPFVALQSVERADGGRITAKVRTYKLEEGRAKETTITLRDGDELFTKTNREEYEDADYIVEEINATPGSEFLEFENGERLYAGSTIGPSREAIFQQQIEETVRQHMQMQRRLKSKGIKVISLFFIDRVANYIGSDAIIRELFEQAFRKFKGQFDHFSNYRAEDVHDGYFAQKKSGEAYNADSNRKPDREARKDAYELIMRDKERLLSLEEPVSFVFAHSALKEGWDNPNVFQICTLNQTVSEIKKRQEIGRGLRICVNQQGERVFDEDINVLTVVANESYEQYASALQSEYLEDGEEAPPKPSNARRAPAHRRDAIFESEDFADFFRKVLRKTSYEISVDTDAVVDTCVERLNKQSFPDSKVVIEKGRFVVTKFTMTLRSADEKRARIAIDIEDTDGNHRSKTIWVDERERLMKTLKDERLRGFRIDKIHSDGTSSRVTFENDVELAVGVPYAFQSKTGQRATKTEHEAPEQSSYPIFNLIDRAARETGLTRPTLSRIFKGLDRQKKGCLFKNPEGFAGTFIGQVDKVLAHHIAENIEFTLDGGRVDYDLENLFPTKKDFPQKELVDAGKRGLYDQVQHDSKVEVRFVENQLKPDEERLVFYLKFPPAFKFDFPRVIGNYNPDWGIVRYDGEDVKLELIRETKGKEDPESLQWEHEKRKIFCARKLFDTLDIDYRTITDETEHWWDPRNGQAGNESFAIDEVEAR